MKALVQNWFLGLKIFPVLAGLYFLISLSFKALNACRENGEVFYSQYVFIVQSL